MDVSPSMQPSEVLLASLVGCATGAAGGTFVQPHFAACGGVPLGARQAFQYPAECMEPCIDGCASSWRCIFDARLAAVTVPDLTARGCDRGVGSASRDPDAVVAAWALGPAVPAFACRSAEWPGFHPCTVGPCAPPFPDLWLLGPLIGGFAFVADWLHKSVKVLRSSGPFQDFEHKKTQQPNQDQQAKLTKVEAQDQQVKLTKRLDCSNTR